MNVTAAGRWQRHRAARLLVIGILVAGALLAPPGGGPAHAQDVTLVTGSDLLRDELPEPVTVQLFAFSFEEQVGVFFEPLGSDPLRPPTTDPVATVTMNASSELVTFEVPEGTIPADYRVFACRMSEAPNCDITTINGGGIVERDYAEVTLRGIRVLPGSGNPGSSANVSGYGFRTSSYTDEPDPPDCGAVELDFGGTDIGSVEIERSVEDVERDHSILHFFTVPDVAPGTYTITATQGTADPGDDCPIETHTTTFQVVETPPEPDPRIEVDPGSGPAGSTTTATVSGFGASAECGPVTVGFDGEEVLEEPAVTTATFWEAGFSEGFTVPDRSPGTYEVVATQTGCRRLSASTRFTVVAQFDPVLTVDPEEGTVESEVEASGGGFEPSVPVVLRLADTLVAIVSSADVDSDGAFTVTFEVPEGTPGDIQDVTACQRCTSTDALEATAEFLVLPRIFIDREVARPGSVIEVTGDGFPTGGTATLSWDLGIGLETVEGDEQGEIRAPMLIFRRDTVGPRELLAEIVDEDLDEDEEPITATEELLVVPGALSPPDFVRRG